MPLKARYHLADSTEAIFNIENICNLSSKLGL